MSPILRRRSLPLFLALLPGTLAALPAAAFPQGYKLSGPLVMTSAGDVQELIVTRDGNWVVYRADQDLNNKFELYATAPTGGQPAVISGPMADNGDVLEFVVSPDGTQVVFRADADVNSVFELWVAPVDGSSGRVRLNGSLPPGGDIQASFVVTPDGSRVVYRADQAVNNEIELYSVSIDGSQAPIQLSAPLVAGGDVRGAFEVTPGGRVIYRADQDRDEVLELYSVPADGSAPPMKLNGTLLANAIVNGFAIVPDGGRVVFRAGFSEIPPLNGYALFSVPADGSAAAIDLSSPLASGGQVFDFAVGPGSARAIFRADREVDQVSELFSVPVDGSASPTKLNGTLVAGGDVQEGVITPDGTQVVYRADQETDAVVELYAVPIDASSSPTKLNDPLVSGGNVSAGLVVSPDASRVIFRADAILDGLVELLSVPIDASQSPVVLNGPLPFQFVGGVHLTNEGAVIEARIEASGARAVYVADQDTNDVFELYSVPLDGSGMPSRISGPLAVEGDVDVGFVLTTDGSRVIYRADQDTDTVTELYGTPVDASVPPVRISGAFAPGPETLGDVRSFEVVSTKERVVYLADQETDGVHELYSVGLDGRGLVALSAPLPIGGEVTAHRVVAAGSRVVYRASQQAAGRFELYTVPIDGSQSPLRLNGELSPGSSVGRGFTICHRGLRVVYQADQAGDGPGLYSVPSDGSADPTMLTSIPARDDFLTITPDGQRVLFLGAPDGLYSAPLDGSAPAVQLSGPLVQFGQVTPLFSAAPDSSRVVYLADQDVDQRFELYSAPVDGSSASVRLNGALASGQVSTRFVITPDSARVLYFADQVSGGNGLYAVQLEGGAPEVMLAGPFPGAGIYGLDVVPDATTAVFIAATDEADVRELYCVPVDGSAARARLSGAMGADRDVFEFVIGPRGDHVAYIANAVHANVLDLYGASLSGPRAPVQLSSYSSSSPRSLGEGAAQGGFMVTPDGKKVVFLYDDFGRAANLFEVPLSGTTAAVPLTRPPPFPAARVFDFGLALGNNAVVYRAQQDGQSTELFMSFLTRPVRRSQSPR